MAASGRRQSIKSKKREDPKLRGLCSEYRIRFEGPVARTSWPASYAALFGPFLEIEAKKWETYGLEESERNRIPPPDEIKRSAKELVGLAYNCRSESTSEEKWRLELEGPVFRRLSSEIYCQFCRNRIWDAVVTAPSTNRALRERREGRSYCTCGTQAIRGSSEEVQTARKRPRTLNDLFSYNAGHDTGITQDREVIGVGVKEPDRVYGLRHTKDLCKLLKSRNPPRHTPFRERSPPLAYPFLVVEAKTERWSEGFSAIEVQSAFPIRALLKIQAELYDSSSASSDDRSYPLVWLLASRGDEWRLYGCVFDDTYYKIFDLWHGYILSKNGALQLLLVIEYISDWANDIYRPSILKHLESFPQRNLRALSRIGSDTWSYYSRTPTIIEERIESTIGIETATMSTSVHETRLVDIGMIEMVSESSMTDVQNRPLEGVSSGLELDNMNRNVFVSQSINQSNEQGIDIAMPDAGRLPWPSFHNPVNESHELLEYERLMSSAPRGSRHWTEFAIVRHASVIKFSFRHLHIPMDGQDEFLDSLRRWDEDEIFTIAIRKLFHEEAIILDAITLDYLAEMWTGKRDSKLSQMDGEVLTSLSYHTYISEEWFVIREVVCISCCPPAFTTIRNRMLNTSDSPLVLDSCWRVSTSEIQSIFTRIRDWNDQSSIAASFVGLYWDLSASGLLRLIESGQVDANWKSQSSDESFGLPWWGNNNNIDDVWYFQHGFSGKPGETKHLQCFNHTESLEYHPIRDRQAEPFFNIPYFPIEPDQHGYILFKRAEPWKEACLAYCLLFCDGSSVFDLNRLIECLSDPSVSTQIKTISPSPFRPDSSHGGCEFSASDQRAIEAWVQALCGEENGGAYWVQAIVESEESQWPTQWQLNFS